MCVGPTLGKGNWGDKSSSVRFVSLKLLNRLCVLYFQGGVFGIQDPYRCNLVLMKELDYETKRTYSLNITAKVTVLFQGGTSWWGRGGGGKELITVRVIVCSATPPPTHPIRASLFTTEGCHTSYQVHIIILSQKYRRLVNGLGVNRSTTK